MTQLRTDLRSRDHRVRRAAEPVSGGVQLLEVEYGEDRQSLQLCQLKRFVYGLDVCQHAERRARVHCPKGTFAAGSAEEANGIFCVANFEVAPPCEMLGYVEDISGVLRSLQALASNVFVSYYLPRSQVVRQHPGGLGYRQIDNTQYDDTVWECFLWTRP